MKRQHILGIVLCGGLWGLSEAVVGGWMYSAGMRQAAPVVLAVAALAILTVGRLHVPLVGSSAAIAALAMLFKFLNEPFFACHLLAIFLLGAGFDAAWSLARGRARPIIGAAATYAGFALFALIITYVFRYHYWVAAGWPKVAWHIGVLGTIAAACNALVVPLAAAADKRMTAWAWRRAAWRMWASRAAAAAAAALWAFAVVVYV